MTAPMQENILYVHLQKDFFEVNTTKTFPLIFSNFWPFPLPFLSLTPHLDSLLTVSGLKPLFSLFLLYFLPASSLLTVSSLKSLFSLFLLYFLPASSLLTVSGLKPLFSLFFLYFLPASSLLPLLPFHNIPPLSTFHSSPLYISISTFTLSLIIKWLYIN